MSKYVMELETPQAPEWDEEDMAEALGQELFDFLAPLLVRLERVLDKRLVRTFAQTILAIVRNRDRARSLVQMELGAMLLGAGKAKAGAKRLRSMPEQAGVEERLDWGVADGGGRGGGQALGSARGDPDRSLGWQCAGEA